MLVAKGARVVLTLEDGRERTGEAGAEALHDATGADWPERSALVTTFRRLGTPLARPSKDARDYLGDELLRGRVKLPPRRLSAWKEVGAVRAATYVRRGKLAGEYEHEFARRALFGLVSRELPVLYERAGALRLELPEGATWDWSGIRD